MDLRETAELYLSGSQLSPSYYNFLSLLLSNDLLLNYPLSKSFYASPFNASPSPITIIFSHFSVVSEWLCLLVPTFSASPISLSDLIETKLDRERNSCWLFALQFVSTQLWKSQNPEIFRQSLLKQLIHQSENITSVLLVENVTYSSLKLDGGSSRCTLYVTAVFFNTSIPSCREFKTDWSKW